MNIQPTSEAASGYVWFGHDCLKLARQTGRPGAKAFRDGRLLVICKYTLDHATLITLSQGDFAMHPRSGTVAKLPYYDNEMNLYTLPGINGGGWRQTDGEFAELATRFGYPLVDDDRGTFLITIDNEELEVEWAGKDSENYGNIWWQGLGDNPPVLSWRGPPSIQFSISGAYNIPGLSQVESISRGKSYYTVFGCFIYRDGRDGTRFCHGPQWFSDNEVATLVVGACYSIDAAGATWLVAICVTRKGAGSFVLQVWRSNDEGTTWNLLNEFATPGRARVPAFIAADGKVFVYNGTIYRIDGAVSSVSRAGNRMPDNPAGTRTITGAGGYNSSYAFNGAGYCWPALDTTGNLVYSSFTDSAAFGFSGDSSQSYNTAVVPIYRGGPATTVSVEIDYSVGMVCNVDAGDKKIVTLKASVNGTYCSVTWSGVYCAKDLCALLLLDNCETSFIASMTVHPQNITGTLEFNPSETTININGDEHLAAGNTYTASNAIGSLTWAISKGVIDESSGKITSLEGLTCGTAVISVTDECGRTGIKDVHNSDFTPVTDITAPNPLVVGSTIAVVGGKAPYTYTADNLTFTGSQVTAINCSSGTKAVANITVTDSCGSSLTKAFKLQGTWVSVSSNITSMGGAVYNDWSMVNETCYSGHLETTDSNLTANDVTEFTRNRVIYVYQNYCNASCVIGSYMDPWIAPEPCGTNGDVTRAQCNYDSSCTQYTEPYRKRITGYVAYEAMVRSQVFEWRCL
jgi:hypothetical protein